MLNKFFPALLNHSSHIKGIIMLSCNPTLHHVLKRKKKVLLKPQLLSIGFLPAEWIPAFKENPSITPIQFSQSIFPTSDVLFYLFFCLLMHISQECMPFFFLTCHLISSTKINRIKYVYFIFLYILKLKTISNVTVRKKKCQFKKKKKKHRINN